MSDFWSDELMSGYLDGELSPSERLQVEAHLKENPRDQERLREFEQQRQCWQSLKSFTLTNSFQSKVMESIRSGSPEQDPSSQPPLVSPAVSPKPSPKKAWSWKATASVIAALATMILVAIVFPKNFLTEPTTLSSQADSAAPDKEPKQAKQPSEFAARERAGQANSAALREEEKMRPAPQGMRKAAPSVANEADEPGVAEKRMNREAVPPEMEAHEEVDLLAERSTGAEQPHAMFTEDQQIAAAPLAMVDAENAPATDLPDLPILLVETNVRQANPETWQQLAAAPYAAFEGESVAGKADVMAADLADASESEVEAEAFASEDNVFGAIAEAEIMDDDMELSVAADEMPRMMELQSDADLMTEKNAFAPENVRGVEGGLGLDSAAGRHLLVEVELTDQELKQLLEELGGEAHWLDSQNQLAQNSNPLEKQEDLFAEAPEDTFRDLSGVDDGVGRSGGGGGRGGGGGLDRGRRGGGGMGGGGLNGFDPANEQLAGNDKENEETKDEQDRSQETLSKKLVIDWANRVVRRYELAPWLDETLALRSQPFSPLLSESDPSADKRQDQSTENLSATSPTRKKYLLLVRERTDESSLPGQPEEQPLPATESADDE